MKFILFALVLIGCKKGRICDCSTTWTFKYSNGSGYDTRIFPSDSKPYDARLTKKQALRSCDHQSDEIQSSFEDLVTNHGKDPMVAGESVKTECILH